MKHITILLCSLFIICITSCNTQNKAPRQTPLERKMNAYMGKSKTEIMMEYGHNPVKDGFVDGLGKVIVYTDLKTAGLGVYANQYYRHTMFQLDADNKVIGWSVRNEQMPFDRLDVRVFKTSF